MADPTMTDEEIAPMTDAHLRVLSIWVESGGGQVDGGDAAALLARLAVEIAARKAAESRALPAPRLMKSVEEVEALPPGHYVVKARGYLDWWSMEKSESGSWRLRGAEPSLPAIAMVGDQYIGPIPLPDLDVPGEG